MYEPYEVRKNLSLHTCVFTFTPGNDDGLEQAALHSSAEDFSPFHIHLALLSWGEGGINATGLDGILMFTRACSHSMQETMMALNKLPYIRPQKTPSVSHPPCIVELG